MDQDLFRARDWNLQQTSSQIVEFLYSCCPVPFEVATFNVTVSRVRTYRDIYKY
jgi:hypothetical protein